MDRVKLRTRAFAACALMVLAAPALAQTAMVEIKRTAADTAAVTQATRHFVSAMSKASLPAGTGKLRSDIGGGDGRGSGGGTTQNPGDLTYQGGAVIPYAKQHSIYLFPNGSVCTSPACWGNISQFLGDLNHSAFMHVTDQYVGTDDGHRYPVVGPIISLHYPLPPNPLVDADMAALAHAAARFLGVSGYGHIFHIFLAPEQNECFDTTYTICSSNYFCAYHSSAFFKDIGEVVYTVEPNKVGVFGCNVPVGSPNGAYDDEYTVLSHELFETITDPDGQSWWNASNFPLFGNEIGDECMFLDFDASGNYLSGAEPVVTLSGHPYQIQTEYNNAAYACTNRP